MDNEELPRRVNIALRLRNREVGNVDPLMDSICPIPFRNLTLQAEYLPNPDEDYWATTWVVDIVIVEDIVIVLVAFGTCTAYNRETREIIRTLNFPDETIRSVLYNKFSESLVIASADDDNAENRHYRSIRIEDIRIGVIDGLPLFDAEPRPITTKFYFRNEKVYALYHGCLTYIPNGIMFIVPIDQANLRNFIYSNPGFLSVMHQRNQELEVDILSVEDGMLVTSVVFSLQNGEDLEFSEHYDDKLLFKEEDEDLLIYDISAQEERNVADFTEPGASAFLDYKREFVTFTGRAVQVWSTEGECLRGALDDHILFYEDESRASHVTHDQEHIMSYCTDNDSLEAHANGEPLGDGSINISCLNTGRCLAKITSAGTPSNITTTAAEALDQVSFVIYDASRHEIYTGNRRGRVHVWSS